MALLLRAVRLSRTRVRGHLFPLTPVLSDHFEKKEGFFWEMVSPKPKIFREFFGFWVGSFELKFREFVRYLCFRVFRIMILVVCGIYIGSHCFFNACNKLNWKI